MSPLTLTTNTSWSTFFVRAMSIVPAFGFVPGGGFALSDHRSFDPAVPHQFIHVPASMARRIYHYVDYSSTVVTLAAESNWPTLAAVASSALRPSHKATTSTPQSSHKTVSVAAASLALRPSHKAATLTPQSSHKTVSSAAASSVPRPSRKAATSTLRSSHKTVSAATASLALWPSHKAATSTPRSSYKTDSAAAPSSALQPSHKAATSTPRSSPKAVSAAVAASSALRPSHKAATSTPRSSHKVVSTATIPASRRVKRRSRKFGPVSHKVVRMLSLCRLVLVMVPVILEADAKKVVIDVKRWDLPLGWCYPPHRHNTYPRLLADYWVQVRTPNKFGPLIRLSKAQARDLEDRGTFSLILRPTKFPRCPDRRHVSIELIILIIVTWAAVVGIMDGWLGLMECGRMERWQRDGVLPASPGLRA
ncbi:hypothetical protein ACLOJK_038666 [Asimina triloba]